MEGGRNEGMRLGFIEETQLVYVNLSLYSYIFIYLYVVSFLLLSLSKYISSLQHFSKKKKKRWGNRRTHHLRSVLIHSLILLIVPTQHSSPLRLCSPRQPPARRRKVIKCTSWGSTGGATSSVRGLALTQGRIVAEEPNNNCRRVGEVEEMRGGVLRWCRGDDSGAVGGQAMQDVGVVIYIDHGDCRCKSGS